MNLYNKIMSSINESLKILLLEDNSYNSPEITWDDNCAEIHYKGGDATLCDRRIEYFRELKDNEYELAILYTPKSYRHQGIATAIMNEVIKIAEQKQCNIVLYASPFNSEMTIDTLIEFYKSFGFEHDSLSNNKQYLIHYC